LEVLLGKGAEWFLVFLGDVSAPVSRPCKGGVSRREGGRDRFVG